MDSNRGSSWDEINPLDLEQQIRDDLKGINLVGELDLNSHSELFQKAESVVNRLVAKQEFNAFERRYPASLVTYLVAQGIYNYRGGAFWDQLSLTTPLQSNQSPRMGNSFLACLRQLSFETFEAVREDENALHFVMPILLHGGIPKYSAPDLWKMLLSEMEGGIDESDQILAKWNSRRSALLGLDKPVQRFLKYGGEFAVDLLQRMIDLVDYSNEIGVEEAKQRDAGELASFAGLPRYLAETLFQAGQLRVGKRKQLPRPRVVIDPYSSEGPSVKLPPFEGSNQDERWFIRWGSESSSVATSRFDTTEFSLEPSDQWTIALGSTGSEWSRAGLEGVALFFFDWATGELLTDQRRIKAEKVIVLRKKAVKIIDLENGLEIPSLETLPSQVDPWTNWKLDILNLRNISAFRVVEPNDQGEGESRFISVLGGGSRPRLSINALSGVSDHQGRSVYGATPSLVVDTSLTPVDKWKIRLRHDSGANIEKNLNELTRNGNEFDIEELLLGGGSIMSGRISVLGPLGLDFHAQLTVVNGLRVTTFDEVIEPEREVEIHAEALGLTLDGHADVCSVLFPAQTDGQSILISDGEQEIEIRISIPRIMWFVRTSDGVRRPFGNRSESFDLRELERGAIEALLIRTRRKSQVRLCLMDGNRELQASEFAETVGDDGRWTFGLREFATTAAHSGKSKLNFKLIVDNVSLSPLAVFMKYEVSEVHVESLVDAAQHCTLYVIEWRENRSFQDRVVWLWSIHQAWREPQRISIDDSATGSTEILVQNDALPPGPYLLEIGIDDPWVEKTRPSPAEPNVTLITLGSKRDLEIHLASRNKDVALECLELVIAGVEPGATLQTFGPNLTRIAPQIGIALNAIFVDRVELSMLNATGIELFKIVSTFPEVLVTCLDFLDRVAGQDDVTALIISVLPDLLNRQGGIISDELQERIWRISLVAGAATDLDLRPGSTATLERWERFTGWTAVVRGEGDLSEFSTEPYSPVEFLGKSVDAQLASLSMEQLGDIIEYLKFDQLLILQDHAFQRAGLRLIQKDDVTTSITAWRSRYNRFNDPRARSTAYLDQALEAVEPAPDTPRWTCFLQDLLASAIHLLTIPASRQLATQALLDALPISNAFVMRDLILVILLTHWKEDVQ